LQASPRADVAPQAAQKSGNGLAVQIVEVEFICDEPGRFGGPAYYHWPETALSVPGKMLQARYRPAEHSRVLHNALFL
jgi:hypothetical protein